MSDEGFDIEKEAYLMFMGTVWNAKMVSKAAALSQLFSKMVESATNAIINGTIEVLLGLGLDLGWCSISREGLDLGQEKTFEVHEDDLSSDKSIWDLYERWIGYHSVSRDLNEKLKRFDEFKMKAKLVYEHNKTDGRHTLALNMFADTFTYEHCCSGLRDVNGKIIESE
ncbi:hypothetical protein HHK36_014594 [Tetracentron sinense]|uniref:Cathepsin propeptide inhibitor domain-containing protein n=1 Tax=Tetracentron sinense TaxID=13715 RepID=A0A834Z7N1_TETSI|nr:hypothetical protein HHK36_014594 [Tetracentron sinense]